MIFQNGVSIKLGFSYSSEASIRNLKSKLIGENSIFVNIDPLKCFKVDKVSTRIQNKVDQIDFLFKCQT